MRSPLAPWATASKTFSPGMYESVMTFRDEAEDDETEGLLGRVHDHGEVVDDPLDCVRRLGVDALPTDRFVHPPPPDAVRPRRG